MNKVLKKGRDLLEFIKEPMLAILAALLISQFVVSHNKIPSESMVATLKVGDHILVNRVPFYYRDPQRGELVVFKRGNIKMIKRLIGEPGDTINIQEGKVYVNEQVIDETGYIRVLDNTYQVTTSKVIYPYTVPKDTYFVMGDNRQESLDSRYFGPIEREAILGKGSFRIYPLHRMGTIK